MSQTTKTVLISALVGLCAAFIGVKAFAPESVTSITQEESVYERVLRTNTLRCAYASVGIPIRKDVKTGEVVGFVADIARAMGEAVGIKIEYVAEVGYADFADGIKTGRYDAFCGILSLAPTRARVTSFTNPIYYNPFYAYTQIDNDTFKVPSDINNDNVRVGVIDGEVFEKITIHNFPKAQRVNRVNMTPPSELFTDLASKKVDVVVHDYLTEKQYSKNNPNKVKKAVNMPIEIHPMGFAVSPYDHELKDMLNAGVAAIQNHGVIKEILRKHGLEKGYIFYSAQPYEMPQ